MINAPGVTLMLYPRGIESLALAKGNPTAEGLMRFDGLLIGIIAFLIIGIFHPIVIKGEYHFTERIWPLFLLAGVVSLALSCFVRQTILSSALGILGCACLWSILELREQTKRVERGWFPRNPKRDLQRDKK